MHDPQGKLLKVQRSDIIIIITSDIISYRDIIKNVFKVHLNYDKTLLAINNKSY